jgi:NADP-dependent 3-hydroxy acid dehydrogenase YdfG
MNRLLVITGASRGIGAAAANEFNQVFQSNTTVLLIARDFDRLVQLKTQIDSFNMNRLSNNTIAILKIDFSDVNIRVDNYVDSIRSVLSPTLQYDELYVVYNHGTLEHGSIVQSIENNDFHSKFETNFFSIWNFLAASQLLFSKTTLKQFHVNINSSYAINAAANWSVQCCGLYTFICSLFSNVL